MKRQLWCIWVTVAVVISLFAVYATADETVTQPTIVFQPGEVTTTGGIKTVEIQVEIRNNPGFVTATIPVKWDPAHLELIEVQNAETYFKCDPEQVYSYGEWKDGWHGMPLADSHNEAGLYYLAWGYDASFQESRFNFMEDGVLATLTFKVIADDAVKSTSVWTVEDSPIANLMNWDMKEQWQELSFEKAEISLEDTIGGLKGDLNLDGSVNSGDLTMLARHVGGIEMIENAESLNNADVNNDGLVNSADLTMHARYVGGIITDWN